MEMGWGTDKDEKRKKGGRTMTLCLQFTTSQGQCEELAGQLGLLEQ